MSFFLYTVYQSTIAQWMMFWTKELNMNELVTHEQYGKETYDELFEACEGLFYRVGGEDLALHCCLFSQETKH